jgi:hypothetical protein
MDSAGVGEGGGSNPIDYDVDLGHPQIGTDIAYGAMTFYRNKNPNGVLPTLQQDDEGAPWLRSRWPGMRICRRQRAIPTGATVAS